MSDPNSDVKSVLLQEINTKHGLSLQLGDVTFSAPELLNATVLDFSLPNVRNSRLSVTAGSAGGPKLDVTVNYNRLDLTKIFTLRNPVFTDTEQTSAHQLLAELSTRLGTPITSADIEDTAINRSGSTPSVILTAKASSLKVIGQFTVTLKSDVTPPEPVMANRMLFANSSVAKLTDDLVIYQDINDQFAPIVVGDKMALMAGLAEGFIAVVQGDYWNENVEVNFRPGDGATWQKTTWVGRVWSRNMAVFNNEAYFAMSDPAIDPWGITCGLYRLLFEVSEGVWSTRAERVLDLWIDGINMDVQLTVDPITNKFLVASGVIHYSDNGVDWERMDIPRLYTGNDASEKPRIIGMGIYNNQLRVLSGSRSAGDGQEGQWMEFVSGDFSSFDPNALTVQGAEFGPHGQYPQISYSDKVSYYFGEEGLFMGISTVEVRNDDGWVDSETDIGQIWKLNPTTQKWVKVVSNTGIINGLFIKLEAALVWAGGNRDNLGGMENLVVSYDDGDTWVSDPSNPDSPFKLDPSRPSSLTAVNLGQPTGPDPEMLPPLPVIIEQSWPDSSAYSGFRAPVAFKNGWLLSAGSKLLWVDSTGTIGEDYSSDYITPAPLVYPLNNGGLILAGNVSKWKGVDTTYTSFMRITPEGEVDTTFVEPTHNSTYTSIPNLYKLNAGGFLVYGTLISWNGTQVDFIIKLNEDFSRDESFVATFDTYNTYMGVTSVTELPDGTILLTAGHHPDRTSRSAWYFLDPATGVEITNYGLDLGTGRQNPSTGSYPVMRAAVTDPDTSDFWIFVADRTLPGEAWGMRFDPSTKQVNALITDGECVGAYLISFLAFNGSTHVVNSTSYNGKVWGAGSRRVDASKVEFFHKDGMQVPLEFKPFNILASDNSGGSADVRVLRLSGEIHLLYGAFGYLDQGPYPRGNRVKSLNLAKVRIPSGLA